VQDCAPQGRGARDLRELEAQTETGIDFQFEILDLKFQINPIGMKAVAGL
jgi:hypothetical protein